MQEIFESFLVETKEILEQLDLDLVELENSPDDSDLLNKIFRSFHTIKGTAGFLGLVKLQKITHNGEDILNKLRKGEMRINEAIMDAILKAYDSIGELVEVIESNKNEDYDAEGVIAQLQSVLDGSAPAPAAKAPVVEEPKQEATPEPEVKPAEEVQAPPAPVEQPVAEPEIEQIEIPKPKQIVEQPKKDPIQAVTAKKGENTIRVDVERLDDLLNFVSELVLGRNMLAQINTEANIEYEGTKLARSLSDATRQIDLMTTELQLAVMKTRMVRIGKVFNRFPRVVRDLAKDAGKKIQLIIKGEETELDKTLIEEINDPLVHLVRNSADHGVEAPEDRVKAGKNEKGTITLSAEHEGNNIIITIEDDGKGIDPEKIKEKAISKGIVSAEKAKELSKQEVFNLIFSPGFSTAEKVTNVSGRGVGMDVVKTNVTKLRGIINIESEVGQGTKMIIKLPLTLAIIHGLLVNVDGEIVVIPLNSVIEIVRVSKDAISSVNQNEVIKLRDTVLPLLNIAQLLYHKPVIEKDDDQQYIVVVGIAEKKFGLKVDDLLGQKEVVIKSLGNYLGNVEGIAGSTIMGDGKVVMIADIAELVNKITDK
ncbi:MAG: chemotaxis protein CheA [Rhodothermaceae bacterium]